MNKIDRLFDIPQYSIAKQEKDKVLYKLADLSLFAKAKDQTLTYFGFEKEELKNLVRTLRGKAIDRIVPVGQALDFTTVWDGYDLFGEFTRRINLLTRPKNSQLKQ